MTAQVLRGPWPAPPRKPSPCAHVGGRCVDDRNHTSRSWRASDDDVRLVNRFMPRLGVAAFARWLSSSVATVDRWVSVGVRAETARGLLARLHAMHEHERMQWGCTCRLCAPARETDFEALLGEQDQPGGRCARRARCCWGRLPRPEAVA